MGNDDLRTRPVLKVCLFSGIDILLSVGGILCVYFLEDTPELQIAFYIFLAIFLVLGLILFCAQFFNWVAIKDNRLIRYRFFIPSKIRFSDITKIKNNNGVFEIYTKKGLFTTISSDDKCSTQIILYLEKKNIDIDW